MTSVAFSVWLPLFALFYVAVLLYWTRVAAGQGAGEDGFFSAGHALAPWMTALVIAGASLSGWFVLGGSPQIACDRFPDAGPARRRHHHCVAGCRLFQAAVVRCRAVAGVVAGRHIPRLLSERVPGRGLDRCGGAVRGRVCRTADARDRRDSLTPHRWGGVAAFGQRGARFRAVRRRRDRGHARDRLFRRYPDGAFLYGHSRSRRFRPFLERRFRSPQPVAAGSSRYAGGGLRLPRERCHSFHVRTGARRRSSRCQYSARELKPGVRVHGVSGKPLGPETRPFHPQPQRLRSRSNLGDRRVLRSPDRLCHRPCRGGRSCRQVPFPRRPY